MSADNFFIVAASSAACEISDYCHSLMLSHVSATSMDGVYWVIDCPWRDEADTLRLISALQEIFAVGPVIWVCDGIGFLVRESDGCLTMTKLGTWSYVEPCPTAFEILGGYFSCIPA